MAAGHPACGPQRFDIDVAAVHALFSGNVELPHLAQHPLALRVTRSLSLLADSFRLAESAGVYSSLEPDP